MTVRYSLFGVTLGLGAGMAVRFALGVAPGLVTGMGLFLYGVLYGLVKWLETPAPMGQARTPVATWRADRFLQTFRILAMTFLFGPFFGLTTEHASGLLFGFTAGCTAGLAVGIGGFVTGLAVTGHHSWLLCQMTTLRLARKGRLPRNLMPLLDDAHRLGLLRAVGPIYQFRHAGFHDHLAADYSATLGIRPNNHRVAASVKPSLPEGGRLIARSAAAG